MADGAQGIAGETSNTEENVAKPQTKQRNRNEDFEQFFKLQSFRLSIAITVFIVAAFLLGKLGSSWFVLVILCCLALWQWQQKLLNMKEFAFREAEVTEHRKKAFENAETVEWLNFFLNRWWVFSDRTLFQLLKNAIDPTLEACKPNIIESIELSDFTVGTRTPFIKYVKIYDTTEDLRKIMANEVIFRNPPADLIVRPKYQVVIDADIALDAPDSKFVLKTNLKIGHTDISIEELQIRGRMQIHVHFNQNIPFPHIAALTFCFLTEPKFHFQIRLLKHVQLMEYPIIRDWISNLVQDSLKYALVDPGHVTLPLCSDPDVLGRRSGYACGVLTLTIKGGTKGKSNEDERWCSVTLGKQKMRTVEMGVDVVWQDTLSMFVDSIQYDKLHIKVKAKRRFGPNITIVEYIMPLVRTNIQQEPIQDLDLKDDNIAGSSLQVHIEYTELPILDLSKDTDKENFEKNYIEKNYFQDGPPDDVAGVLFVRVHRGTKLIPMDPDGLSDPYCMIFANKELCHISKVIEDTLNPEWDTMVEFFTADYTQTTLSFIINDRNPVMFSSVSRADDNDDFMGSCNLVLKKEDWLIYKREIDVFFKLRSPGGYSANPDNPNLAGSICVSVIFRPVPSLLKSIKPTKNDGFPEGEPLIQKHTKMDAVTMEALLCAERGSLTIKLHRARNLVPMDLNGKSDPFAVVRVGQNKTEKYKTKICYRTLYPVWNEEVTFAMPETHQKVIVEVWDKDPFTNEKMGHVVFDHHFLKRISKQTEETKEWYQLRNVKCGEVQLTLVVRLPEKAKEPEKIKKSPAIKTYSLTSNDYIMLDMVSEKEDEPKTEGSTSSSVESDSSGTEDMTRNLRVDDDGSPQIDKRRIIVPANSRKHKLNNNVRSKDLGNTDEGASKATENAEHDEQDLGTDIDSCTVRESGIVDLSRDPLKYNGLKGEIVALTDVKIPQGVTSLSVRLQLDKAPNLQKKRSSFFASSFNLCRTDFLPIEELAGIHQKFNTKAEQGFSPVTYLVIDVKNRKETITSGSITLSNLFKGENPVKRMVDLDNGGKIHLFISYEQESIKTTMRKFSRSRASQRV